MKKNFRWRKRKHAAIQIAIRIILGILICAATISTIYIGRKPYGEALKEGDIAPRTVYAPMNFEYRLGVDEEKTLFEREKSAANIDQVYSIDTEVTEKLLHKLAQFFTKIVTVQAIEVSAEEKLSRAQEIISPKLSTQQLKTFLNDANTAQTWRKTADLLKNSLLNGIISKKQLDKLHKSQREYIILTNFHQTDEQQVGIAELKTLAAAKKELTSNTQALFPEKRKLRIATIELLRLIAEPNIGFNKELTKQKRKSAYRSTPLQYRENKVKKAELIVTRGERIHKRHLLKIKEMIRRQIKANRFTIFSGATIITLLFLLIISLYLKRYEPKVFLSTRKLTLIGVLFILILGLAKIITDSPWAISNLPSYAIPTAIASILIAMLIGPRLAIIVTIALSIFVGIIAGDKLNVTTVSFVGGIVGIFFIRGARRRSQILVTGCLVGLANFTAICALELLHGFEYSVLLKEGFWGLINGIGSAVIVTAILPIFEYSFNMVTNISLLELSDLNHPLLREMLLKAPGTYHHSLIVGNLAEAATEAIGKNALLARVGSYFHDIGKTEKAEYFSENQIGLAKKKHDKLSPSISSLIITNHVKDGIDLARKYRLNHTVVDFIEQHHGNSLIYYFYQRALEKVEDDQLPKEEGFRYPGPKPQTKETAVVLLADSVEAASRALSEPTPSRIKGLVRKIINNKFIDNQLDQCELTLKDLEVIADTFTRILMGIFHSRVEYNATEKPENRHKQQAEKNSHK